MPPGRAAVAPALPGSRVAPAWALAPDVPAPAAVVPEPVPATPVPATPVPPAADEPAPAAPVPDAEAPEPGTAVRAAVPPDAADPADAAPEPVARDPDPEAGPAPAPVAAAPIPVPPGTVVPLTAFAVAVARMSAIDGVSPALRLISAMIPRTATAAITRPTVIQRRRAPPSAGSTTGAGATPTGAVAGGASGSARASTNAVLVGYRSDGSPESSRRRTRSTGGARSGLPSWAGGNGRSTAMPSTSTARPVSIS